MENSLHLEVCSNEGKYLTFSIIEENYGINVDWIMQIIAIPTVTQIPQTPQFVKGVINLRGKIIPVMDLRLRFNLPEQAYDERTSIIVLNISVDEDEIYIGLIVDKVLEVIDINVNEIESAPPFGVEIDTDFILAMAKVKGKIVTLLDISKILTEREGVIKVC